MWGAGCYEACRGGIHAAWTLRPRAWDGSARQRRRAGQQRCVKALRWWRFFFLITSTIPCVAAREWLCVVLTEFSPNIVDTRNLNIFYIWCPLVATCFQYFSVLQYNFEVCWTTSFQHWDTVGTLYIRYFKTLSQVIFLTQDLCLYSSMTSQHCILYDVCITVLPCCAVNWLGFYWSRWWISWKEIIHQDFFSASEMPWGLYLLSEQPLFSQLHHSLSKTWRNTINSMEMNQWTDQTDTLSSSVCQDIGYRYTSLDGYQEITVQAADWKKCQCGLELMWWRFIFSFFHQPSITLNK